MSDQAVHITDFRRSFIRFRMDTLKKPPVTVSQKLPMTLNNVRGPLECVAVLTDLSTGAAQRFALMASCKSEQVWVKRDIWHQPNADMTMIAGEDEFLVYKRWDKLDKGVMLFPPSLGPQPERQLARADAALDSYALEIRTCSGRLLTELDDLLAALFDTTSVVAQTEYEAAGYRVLLEYPVKVVNFSERERYYQVDTGPVLLPDFAGEAGSLIERLQSAFVAHNCRDWAEFIVCAPTPLTEDMRVHHYSRSLRLDGVENRMIAVV
jgi:hypothetical protein